METHIGFYISAVFLMLLISAFFSAAETGLTALSRAKIHKLRMEGNKRAILVTKIRQNKDRLLAALLLGNNLVNTAASAITTSVLIKLFGEEGVLYATAIITVLIVIFSEVAPKTYAFAHSEKVALLVAPLISIIVKIFGPVVTMIEKIISFSFRFFGISIEKPLESSRSAMDLIRGTIDLHHHEGVVFKHDRDMLGSIIDLAETEVGEVMVHRKNMVTINIDLPMEKIIERVLSNAFTRIPVWKDNPDNILGILNIKDLMREIHNSRGNLSSINLEAVLSDPWFIPSTTILRDQLFAFREKRNHFALVIDEYSSLMGMITLEDILEEIVGHIHDEHDNVFIGIMKEADGSYIVDGSVTVRDLNRQLDWDLPDDKDASTVAGILIEMAKIIPDPGEIFDIFGIRFEVLKKKRNQVLYLRLKRA